jgi:hypothetical protein
VRRSVEHHPPLPKNLPERGTIKKMMISEQELIERERQIIADAEMFGSTAEELAELKKAIDHARAIRHGEAVAA